MFGPADHIGEAHFGRLAVFKPGFYASRPVVDDLETSQRRGKIRRCTSERALVAAKLSRSMQEQSLRVSTRGRVGPTHDKSPRITLPRSRRRRADGSRRRRGSRNFNS
eukprot:1100434-Rhodomonas_salina.1